MIDRVLCSINNFDTLLLNRRFAIITYERIDCFEWLTTCVHFTMNTVVSNCLILMAGCLFSTRISATIITTTAACRLHECSVVMALMCTAKIKLILPRNMDHWNYQVHDSPSSYLVWRYDCSHLTNWPLRVLVLVWCMQILAHSVTSACVFSVQLPSDEYQDVSLTNRWHWFKQCLTAPNNYLN